MRQRDDRVGAFEAEDVADRRVASLPRRLPVRRCARAAPHHGSARSRRAPPSPDTTRAAPASAPRPAPGSASRAADARASRSARSASPRTGRCLPRASPGRDGPPAAVRLVGQPLLSLANFLDRPRQIAVPLERVHGEIKVGVENQHRRESPSNHKNNLINGRRLDSRRTRARPRGLRDRPSPVIVTAAT